MADINQSRQKISSQISIFFKDADFYAFGYKKAERLAAVVHLLTEYVSYDEPLRPILRAKSIDIVSATLPFRFLEGAGEGRWSAIQTATLEIVSVLQIAASARLISGMNAEIVADEYVALASFLRARNNTNDLSLDVQNLYAEALSLISPASPGIADQRGDHEYKGQFSKGHFKSSPQHKDSVGATKETHRSRATAILQVLKKQKTMTIKDAMSVIQNCSGKTIQRELLRLVEDGVLKKEGERRWSTYSLVS